MKFCSVTRKSEGTDDTYQCTPKTESYPLTEIFETPPYLQDVILVPRQRGMVKLLLEFLSYQTVLMHFQLFYMSQSAHGK